MCTVLLPPVDNPIAVNKYININNRVLNKTSLFLRRRFVLYITAQEWYPLFHEVHINSLEQRNVLVECMLIENAALPVVTLQNNKSTALTTQKSFSSYMVISQNNRLLYRINTWNPLGYKIWIHSTFQLPFSHTINVKMQFKHGSRHDWTL